MRVSRTFAYLLTTGLLGLGAGACVVDEGSPETPTATTGVVPQDAEDPGGGNDAPGDPNTPDPGSTDDGGGVQYAPSGVGGGQTND